ncbi:hypothetical protein MTO96_019773 [Rhipicephalus appendiculatus]
MLAVLFLLTSTWLAQALPSWNGTTNSSIIDMRETSMSTSTTSTEHPSGIDYVQLLRDLMPRVLSSIPAPLRRKLLEADVRPECTAGLLRTMRGFQNLEPWAFRLFDASGKYPTGLLEGSHVDMGAFDECLRTVVRDGFGNVLSQGQYCNLLVYVNNGTAIEEMLESYSDVLHPRDVLPHLWYLSADFQLFVISLLVLLILKGRKTLMLGAFTFLSLLGCIVGTCIVAGLQLPPFMIFPGPIPDLMLRTLDEYYIRPYYHGRVLLRWLHDIPHRGRLQGVEDIQEAAAAAFFDRILWTLFLAWITLACSTSRGGVLSKLLSWNAYVPLSKLSFGVYLIHVPFLHLWFYSSRERRFWSVFNQVTLLFALLVWSFILSYLAFLVCEAPTAALDKLVFTRLIGGRRNTQTAGNSSKRQPGNSRIVGSDVKKQDNAEDNTVSRC